MHGISPACNGIVKGYAIAYWAKEAGYLVWWLFLGVMVMGWWGVRTPDHGKSLGRRANLAIKQDSNTVEWVELSFFL
jgi:hypothetical protein